MCLEKDYTNEQEVAFMREAINLARIGMERNEGGPFGAVIVKDGKIIGRGHNTVTSSNDPTAHAEMNAIREACEYLQDFQLIDCTIYTSCEPCPMCLGAIYWARLSRIIYASDRYDAANIDFDDQFIYDELQVPYEDRQIKVRQMLRDESIKLFKEWEEKSNKKLY